MFKWILSFIFLANVIFCAEIRFEGIENSTIKQVEDDEIISFFQMYNGGELTYGKSYESKYVKGQKGLSDLLGANCKLCYNPVDTIIHDNISLEFYCDGINNLTTDSSISLNAYGHEYSRYLRGIIRSRHCANVAACSSNSSPKPMVLFSKNNNVPLKSTYGIKMLYRELARSHKKLTEDIEFSIKLKYDKETNKFSIDKLSDNLKELFESLNSLVKNERMIFYERTIKEEKIRFLIIIKTKSFPKSK